MRLRISILGKMEAILKVQTRLTSQGQVSVPAAVRNFLHLTPGSTLVWSLEGDRVVVERAKRHTTAEVHASLFTETPLQPDTPKTLEELKQGICQRMRQRHAGG